MYHSLNIKKFSSILLLLLLFIYWFKIILINSLVHINKNICYFVCLILFCYFLFIFLLIAYKFNCKCKINYLKHNFHLINKKIFANPFFINWKKKVMDFIFLKSRFICIWKNICYQVKKYLHFLELIVLI